MSIEGTCDPRFERVRDEFARNFAERGEVGACVCVTVDGETVVDLWGGTARTDTGAPWQKDTIGIVWSCTKGATALCAHILASRGQLDINAPVVKYWPEFGQAGKEKITVKMLLNHQAGLPAVRKPLPQGAYYDWNLMVKMLAEQEPLFEPGTRNGYHGLTFGWLVGEVVRRISGKSLGTFFRDEVAVPLGIDFFIGLPAELEPRVAPTMMADPPDPNAPLSPFYAAVFSDPSSIAGLLMLNAGGYMAPGEYDTRAAHASEIGAAGGIANARGLAGMYAPLACGGSLRGLRLVDADTLARMASVSSATGQDATLLAPTRFAVGFMKSIDNRGVTSDPEDSIIMSEAAFGHSGFGGSLGFADPRERMSFGYMMNKMGPGIGINTRGQSLVDAIYLCLGYKSNASGVWI